MVWVRQSFWRIALFSIGITLLLCCGGPIALSTWTRISAEQKLDIELSAFDPLFASNTTPPPSTSTAEILLPARVGKFQRADINLGDLGSGFATYSLDNEEIGVLVSKLNGQTSGDLQTLVGKPSCDSELEGPRGLRTSSKSTFLYQMCPGLSDQVGSLAGIAWISGDWIVSISGSDGDSKSLLDFLAAYPYR